MPDLGKLTVLVAGDAAPLSAELVNAERQVAQSAEKMRASLATVDDLFVSIADSAKAMTTSVSLGLERITSVTAKARDEQASLAGAFDRTATAAKTAGDVGAQAAEKQAAGASDAVAAQRDVQAQYEKTAAAAKATGDVQARSAAAAATSATNVGRAASNSAKQAEAAFGSSSSALTKWGGKIALGLAAGIAGADALAIKFQGLTTVLNTQAGASTAHVKELSSGILKMAGDVGQSPNHLAEAMYHVVSAMNKVLPPTQQVTKELEVQKAAAEGAAIGHANLDQTTYALSSAMMTLGAAHHNAYETMASLNAIVGVGDMRMQEFVTSLRSGVLPTAINFGVSLNSMGAALAYMTDRGTPAVQAATRLRMAMTMMGAPTKQAGEELAAVGMSAGEIHTATKAMSLALEESGVRVTKLAHDMRQPDGIQVALTDLMDHLKGAGMNAEAAAALLARAFGGARSGSAIMTLIQHLDQLKQTYHAVNSQQSSFGKDWGHTQETLQFQLHQMEGRVLSFATVLGKELIPPTEHLLKDLQSVAEWFGHNERALKALEYTVATFATVTIGSYFVSKIKSAIQLMKEFGKAATALGRFMVGGPLPFGSKETVSPTSAARASSVLGSESGLGIGGARSGFGLPGSMENPLIVAMIDGQVAGLGGNAAGSLRTAETRATAAESAQGVLFPEVGQQGQLFPIGTAGPAAAAGEEAVVGASIGKSILGSVGTGLTSLLRGGLVAGTGLMAAQIGGSLIGGSAGHTVSSYGSAAAIGAGIGSVIEPGIGTAVGAALGPAVLALKELIHNPPGTAEIAAHNVTSGRHKYGKKTSEELDHAIENLWKNADNEIAKFKGHSVTYTPQNYGVLEHKTVHTPEERRKIQAITEGTQYKEGAVSGSVEAEAFQKGQVSANINDIIRTTISNINKLAPAAKAGYVNAMKAMVETLQKEGRLPENAWDQFNHAIKDKLSSITQYSATASMESMKAWEVSLKAPNALKSADEFVQHIFGDNKKIVAGSKASAEEQLHSLHLAEGEMEHIIEQSHGARRALFTKLYQDLKAKEHSYNVERDTAATAALQQINKQTEVLSKAGARGFASSWAEILKSIENTMQLGLISTTHGSQLIGEELQKAFHALGIKPNVKGMSGFVAGAAGAVSSFFGGGKGKAIGGFIGQQGEAGHDTEIIAAGRGEAVINRHQIPYVQMGLKAIGMSGGLPELFGRVTTPHSAPSRFAQGGAVGGPSELAAMLAEANKINSEHLPYSWGGGHGTAGVPSFGSASSSGGPTVRGYDCSGSVSAVLHAGGLLARPEVSGELMHWGLPGPGAVTVYANPVHTFMSLNGRFFGTHGADGAGWYTGSALPGFTQRHAPGIAPGENPSALIKEPHLAGLAGAVGGLAQGSISKQTQAARQVLANELRRTMSEGGGSGGGDWGTMPHGDIMKLAEFASKADGVPWQPNLVRTLLSKESQGGQNLAPHNYGGGLDPAGPFQVISSTFAQYARPGHSNRMNPLDNALAAFAYIKSRYGTMSALAQSTGLLGSGYKGYAGGGITGGSHAPHGSPRHQAEIQRSKGRLSRGRKHNRNRGSRSHRNTSIHALTAPFREFPDVEELPEVASPLESQLSIFDQQYTLLGQIEQDPHGAFILPEDMSYLTPTFPPNLTVGMDTGRAKRMNEEAISAAGEASPELTLQGQLLDWITGQDSHHLITGSDMGILGATIIDGIPIHPGMNILQAEFLNRMYEEGLYKSESRAYTQALNRIASAIQERRQRKQLIEVVASKALQRKRNIEKHIQQLAIAKNRRRVHKAKRGLSQAEAKAMTSELVYDAETHKEAISSALSFERGRPKKVRNESYVRELESQMHNIDSQIHGLRHPRTNLSNAHEEVTGAYESLLNTELHQSLKPIGEELSKLDGSSTSVGAGGELGKITKDIKGLSSGASKFQSAILTINSQSLPMLQLDFRNIQDASEAPIAPTLPKSTSTSEKEQLLGPALEEKLRLVEQENLVLKAQAPVFKEMVGSFAVGTTYVPRTGKALVHEGEAIIPKSLNPFLSGSGAGLGTTEVHLHGDLADFTTRVESVVNGKKRDISNYVNKQLARNAQSRRLLPV